MTHLNLVNFNSLRPFALGVVLALLVNDVTGQDSQIAGSPDPLNVNAKDFESLQAAVDALPSSGGMVTIPPGVFSLEQPLRIKTPDTLIRGSGAATHLKNINTDGMPSIVIAAQAFDGKTTVDSKRLWRVQLSDLRISGNEKSGDGIVAHQVNEIFIEGVTISYHGRNGILLDNCYEDPRLSDNLITYNQADGIRIEGGHDIVVAANHFEENQSGLRCMDSFNLTMTGNNLDDHLGDGVIIENTYGSVLSGNMIEECNGWGVILDRDCYGITISANVIAHEFTGGIDLRDAHGCAVSANTFTIVKNVGLAVRKDSGRITITGNNFSDSFIGNGKHKRDIKPTPRETAPDAAGGLILETEEPVVVVGNLFGGIDGEPIVGKSRLPKQHLQTNLAISE